MTLIASEYKQRYHTLSQSVSASIQRHPVPDIKSELLQLANSVQITDERDNYGSAGLVGDFEQSMCSLFNKPASVFLPTGTLAQCAAAKCYSEQSNKQSVALHPTSHLLLHEHRAIEALWGLDVAIVGKAHQPLSIEDLDSLNPDTVCALFVELPMREIGGALPTWDDLEKLRKWCNTHKIKLHMDGARLWQTTPYYQRSLADIAALFDSIYVSYYKDLGGTVGAMLLGTESLIADTKIWARRAGGNPITQYPDVLAARNGIANYLNRMPDYVAFTAALYNELSSIGVGRFAFPPKVNLFHLEVDLSTDVLAKKIIDYAEQKDILVLPLPRSGNTQSCICEINIGENALSHPPAFWAKHIAACLSL
ncbi:threonine aldolase [Alteromonas sediminis]|uniref:Threonine aldolase n=1 Tax=Alteromonas sediminis TaxID=2259342 RepID=A0A3N5Y2W3_9ALTE|nr:beta-eliminating lyase-related protein [Alteromonas sediminis]RPJ67026.1 threonine aldolase [Alteromonas sediminis]